MTSPTFAESVENLLAAGRDLPAGLAFDQIRDKMHIAADEAIESWVNGEREIAYAYRGKLRGLLESARLFAV